jgi:DNA-binding MarR family transcriptional regulator
MQARLNLRPAEDWKLILSDQNADNARLPSDEVLLFRLFTEIGIIHQLSNTAFQQLLPHSLTGAQFAVLNHCVRMGDSKTPAQLADILQVTRGTMTSTLRRLEAKGFIRFLRNDRDGRSKRVVLTTQGRKARESSIVASLPLLAKVRGTLPRHTVERLLPELEALRIWLDGNRAMQIPFAE